VKLAGVSGHFKHANGGRCSIQGVNSGHGLLLGAEPHNGIIHTAVPNAAGKHFETPYLTKPAEDIKSIAFADR
jgi:hypothetical protein